MLSGQDSPINFPFTRRDLLGHFFQEQFLRPPGAVRAVPGSLRAVEAEGVVDRLGLVHPEEEASEALEGAPVPLLVQPAVVLGHPGRRRRGHGAAAILGDEERRRMRRRPLRRLPGEGVQLPVLGGDVAPHGAGQGVAESTNAYILLGGILTPDFFNVPIARCYLTPKGVFLNFQHLLKYHTSLHFNQGGLQNEESLLGDWHGKMCGVFFF